MSQATTTICNIKNITRSSIIYQISNDWQGSIGAGGFSSYPTQIPSNATVNFQQVGNPNGSQGAVVYRISSSTGKAFDVLVAWFNQPNAANKAYTLVYQVGSFTTNRWTAMFNQLINGSAKSSSTVGGCASGVEIGGGNFPTLSATVSTA